MQTKFELNYPPIIVCGWGERRALAGVLDRLAVQNPLLVTTRTLARGGTTPWEACCQRSMAGAFSGVPHDPPLATVEEIAELARKTNADGVVAAGGGSVLDAAKAAAVWATAEKPLRDYFHGGAKLERPGLPFIALPTTAGSGAEITKNAVLTDPDGQIKKSLRSLYMVPDAAVVDAELTVTMPPPLTAASGLDALTQAVENFIGKKTNPASRALAKKAACLILANLRTAYSNGEDRDARERMAEGSLLSALAFSQGSLGAVHGLAHPIGAVLNIPHGYTCAVLLPHILEFNRTVCEAELRELAQAVGLRSVEEFITGIKDLGADLGVPADFRADNLSSNHFDHIIKNCRSGSMAANPRDMSDDDIRELLNALSGGK